MMLVTGATGTIGRELVAQLLERGVAPRLLVRDPAKVAHLAGRAQIAQGDLGDPATLAPALAGVSKLFLLASGPALVQHEANAIDAARAAGVQHVVYLSVLGADAERPNAISVGHRASQARLEASGMAWTFVQPGGFMSNALGWAKTIKARGEFYAPDGTGKTTLIDPRDIAAVAATALTQPGHEGKRYPLTGPQALSGADHAAILTRVLGRPVAYVDIAPEVARKGMLDAGVPAPIVEALLDFAAVVRAGHAGTVLPTVEQVLGRPAGTFEQWARAHADAFR